MPDRGAVVLVSGVVERARSASAGFDERAWLSRRGIHEVVRVRRLELVATRGGVAGFSDDLRTGALRAAARVADDDATRLVGAIALGADERLSRSARDDFTAAGLAHLIAVSGQNIAYIVVMLFAIVWSLGGNRRLAFGLSTVAVPLYTIVVGPSASVLRAAVAGVLMLAAWFVSRPIDRWHLALVALGILLMINPHSAADPGLQLSFAAVVAIHVAAKPVQELLEGTPLPTLLHVPLALALVCGCATAPISWWHFGTTSLVATVPANIAAAPSVPLLLGAGLLTAALAPLSQPLAETIVWAARPVGVYLMHVASTGAAVEDVVPPVIGLAVYALSCLVVALAILSHLRFARERSPSPLRSRGD